MARIYLDHNAGSPLRPEARAAIERLLGELSMGNPASIHRSGQRARAVLESARQGVAQLIGAAARQIVFTSGGTEANNLAVFGAVAASSHGRIVTSTIEHSSVIAAVAELERRGFEVVRVPVDRDGMIDPAAVISAINGTTALVTMGLANSEVGAIQELSVIGEAVEKAGGRFHIDAVQAVGRIPIDVSSLRCDLMTLSAHKIGALAGIGALYFREPDRVAPLFHGGSQEGGFRPGTPNLIGAAAFGAAAIALAERLTEESARIANLTEHLRSELVRRIPGLLLNGPVHARILNTLNFAFPDVLGESMLMALDLDGVEVSMGSACAAGSVEPSHVLMAMGRNRDEARSSLRLSLGWSTTAEEIGIAAEKIDEAWRRVRAAEPAIPMAEAWR
jgi:cysteine desulfurase